MSGNRPWLNTVYKKTCIVNCFQTSLVEVWLCVQVCSRQRVLWSGPGSYIPEMDRSSLRRTLEEDPFGLNKFLTEAKKAKRPVADRLVLPTVYDFTCIHVHVHV